MGTGRLPARLSAHLAAVLLLGTLGNAAQAGDARLLLHTTPIAGLAYHEAGAVWPRLKVGAALQLRADPANPHDARAIEVRWEDHLLGYLPANANAPLADALARGKPLVARIHALREHPNPRERIRIDVLLSLR